MNSCVKKIYDFIAARGNPYVIRQTGSKLHHFITCQLFTSAYAVRLLSFTENGKSGHLEFRNERFKEKLKKLSDTITKVKLPSFHSDATMDVPGKKSAQVSEVKDITKAQRLINIAKRRGASLSDIHRHDMLTKNVLFDGDFTVKPAKHVMIEELEAHLDKEEDFTFEKESELSSSVFVDFMSVVRSAPLKKMHMFSEVLEFLWNSCTKVCKADQVNFIFDSCIENSIKEGER